MENKFITVVEVQFLRDKNDKYWIKELCILKSRESFFVKSIFVFRPPHDWNELSDRLKRINKYSESYLHQLAWEEGTTDYSDMKRILKYQTEDSKYIFCKGQEKCELITKILERDVVDLTFESPSFRNMETTRVTECFYRNHNNDFCAYINAHKLLDFVKGKKRKNCNFEFLQ